MEYDEEDGDEDEGEEYEGESGSDEYDDQEESDDGEDIEDVMKRYISPSLSLCLSIVFLQLFQCNCFYYCY